VLPQRARSRLGDESDLRHSAFDEGSPATDKRMFPVASRQLTERTDKHVADPQIVQFAVASSPEMEGEIRPRASTRSH
jgi:hypothetical protein